MEIRNKNMKWDNIFVKYLYSGVNKSAHSYANIMCMVEYFFRK